MGPKAFRFHEALPRSPEEVLGISQGNPGVAKLSPILLLCPMAILLS